jgi:RNA polymerase sigma-70 factor (ECF subfamily)
MLGEAERRLVARAQAGEQEAFRGLFDRYHRRLYNLAMYLLDSPELAAEATQEAFIKAWAGLGRLRDVGAFETWLYRITHNAVQDLRRRQRARAEEETVAHDAPVLTQEADGDAAADPERALARQAVSEAVRWAIGTLPEAQRAPIVMFHLQGMEVRDIAQALGVPEGTVLSRLARGREALRLRLAPYLAEGEV